MPRSETLVEVGPGGVPRRVRLGGPWRRVVRLEEAWVAEGQWWAGERRREYVRVALEGAIVVLYRGVAEDEPSAWRLARVLD